MKKLNKALVALSVQAALVSGVAVSAEQDSQDDGKLEKITVTALKRTQSIQDVPVSIATLSGEKLENIFAAGDDVLALATRVPGLYAESSNGRVAPRFYMRGIGNTDFDLAASQPVSIIMDDVVMENVVLKSFPLFDVDQVEVIRGPQGTLFGRNTTAGIIKFTSKKPTDDFDTYVRAGLGTNGLKNFEGAVGGGLTDKLSARVSLLNQSRDDFIDNSFTGKKDVMGGFEEQAYRIQLAYEFNDQLDALFNYHGRSLDGTSSIFRANVLDKGSNELNENYDRETVQYDAGDDNPQEYDSDGWSLSVNYDMGAFTLTSITAMESADGRSKGDIDGGYGANFPWIPEMGPGVIPFDALTEDKMKGLSQFTQEIRLASNGDSQLTWQTGFFYFDSEFNIETIDGFLGTSEVEHTNSTWAVFGQSTYALSNATTLVAGVRYTSDEKTLTVIGERNRGANEFAPIDTYPAPVDNAKVDDGQVSWEFMVNHKLSDSMSVFARAANGFRAQSIQGRDVNFGGNPSIAEAETIMSYEAGFKSDLLDNTLRLNGALFSYTIDDIQLTAVGGNGNLVGLTNAGKGVGSGFEIDAEYRPIESLTLTAGFSYNKTELQDEDLLIGVCGSLANNAGTDWHCTPTDPLNEDGTAAYVDGNPFPNAPETILTFTARYSIPVGEDGEAFVYSDYAHQGKTNIFLYEAEEFNTDGQFELGLRAGYYDYNLDMEVAVFGRNITDEDNLKGAIDFNNNTGIVNEGASWGIEFKKSFF